jgi:predicted DNA-binding transcriptional regulator AlpA
MADERAGQSAVFITEKSAAQILSLSHRTLQSWRQIGKGPPFVKLGRSIRYERTAVIGWINALACATSAKGHLA